MRIPIRPSLLVFLLIASLVAFVGGQITESGLLWYSTIAIPSIAPPGAVIGIVWTTIFTLTAISAYLAWQSTDTTERWRIMSAFVVNALLNVGWSAVFFAWHAFWWAIVEAIFLEVSVLVLIVILWKKSKIAALLLIPYAVWVLFATYLMMQIARLNA